MRLIDADELLKHKCDVYGYDNHLLYAVPTGYICSAKTIEAESVVHASWKAKGLNGRFICTNCNHLAYDSNDNYCPHCGARMNEVSE